MHINGFELTCPRCGSAITLSNSGEARCPSQGDVFVCMDGIWRFLLSERQNYYSVFIDEYQHIRQAEGRGSEDPEYYRHLPYTDSSGRMSGDWRIRATSFRIFLKKVLQPLERSIGKPLKCLDMGAGNAWLSNQLAQRGHLVAAIDLLTNDWDGLGAYLHYESTILPVQAEFDRLPFEIQQCDLVIFNASLHYSTDYMKTLKEAFRVLKPGGKIIVLDTPVYHSYESGQQMVEERQAQFMSLYGFPSNALPSENFLTYARIDQLSQLLRVQWCSFRPNYGLSWSLRPWIAKLTGRREPAVFFVLVWESSV